MIENNRDRRWNQNREDRDEQEMIRRLGEERRQKEQLARQLADEARQQWQKTIEGFVAFPAALTLGIASSVMTFAGFLARGFEVFNRQAQDMRNEWRATEHEPQFGQKQTQQPPTTEPNKTPTTTPRA